MPKKTPRPMWFVLMPIIAGMAIIGIAIVPLAFIWALNVLFRLDIAYTFTTWFAALIIVGVLHHSGMGKAMRWRKDE